MHRKQPIFILFLILFLFSFLTLAPSGFSASGDKIIQKQPISPGTQIIPKPIQAVAPSLKITYFKKKVEGDSSMMMMARPGSAEPTSASINLGDEIKLVWGVESCRLRDIRTSIGGIGNIPFSSQENTSDECVYVKGEKTVKPARTTTYTFNASGTPIAGDASRAMTANKTFQVNVLKPVLEILDPQINQNSLVITFSARNSGEADFRPTPINVSYEVYSGRTGPTILTGSLTTPAIGIERGQRVELGSITLPDRNRAFSDNSIRIRLRVGASYPMPLEEASGMFHHDWEQHSLTLDNSLLRLMSMGSLCEIRLNNYNPSGGSTPVVRNDSFVHMEILGTGDPMQFDSPVFRGTFRMTDMAGTTWIEKDFAMFINAITTLSRGSSDLFSIQEGKFKIHLDFDNTGNSEIKLGGMEDGNFRDRDLPDINIGPFTVDVLLTPGVRNNRIITYTNVEIVVPTISASLVGRYEGLNPFVRDYLGRYVRSEIISQLNAILTRPNIKQAVEDGIAGGLGASNITRIISVRGVGGSIVVTYL